MINRVVLLGSLFLLLTGFSGCGGNGRGVAEADTVTRRFVGTIPAADGPGIVMDLMLSNRAMDSTQGGYVLRMTYLEGENGKDVRFDSRGGWVEMRGVPEDERAVYYRLIGLGEGRDTMNFLYLGDSVVMLAAGLRRIDSGLNYTLVKVE